MERKNYDHKHQEAELLRLKSRTYFIMANAIEKTRDHDFILERLNKEIYSTDIYKGLTINRRYYLRGYVDAFITQITSMIIWKVYHPELGLITGEEVPKDDWYKILSIKSKFVWKSNGMPYSLSEEERIAKNGKA